MYTHSNKEFQENLTPEQAIEVLKEGNERFVKNQSAKKDLLQLVDQTKKGQYPFATVLSCIDSRVPAEMVFDQGIGDLFSVRIAGNIVNDDILGSMEFATAVTGSKVVVVLGHTSCGAIKGACDNVELGNLTGLLHKVKPAIEKETSTKDERSSKNTDFVNNVTEINVRLAMDEILEKSPIIKDLVDGGKVKLVGGIYEVETGKVKFL